MLLFSFQTEEQERIKHKFRHYYFHRPRVCFFCKQRVFSEGSACQGNSYFSYNFIAPFKKELVHVGTSVMKIIVLNVTRATQSVAYPLA